MNPRRNRAILGFACLIAAFVSRAARAAEFNGAYIDNILQPISQDPGVAGISAIIVAHGQVIYQNYYGGHQAGDVLDLASASKYLSAATFMTLWDQPSLGVDLDAPLSSFVPQFAAAR